MQWEGQGLGTDMGIGKGCIWIGKRALKLGRPYKAYRGAWTLC